MLSLGKALANYIPLIDSEQIVTKVYGPQGLVELDSPTKASLIKCYGCGGSLGYLNIHWNAWCCQNETCWGPLPKKEENGKKVIDLEKGINLADHGVQGEDYLPATIDGSSQLHQRKSQAKKWAHSPKGFLIFAGSSGRGKTYFACAMLKEAVLKGWRNSFFISITDLNTFYLEAMRIEGNLGNLVTKYAEKDLLILDELGINTPTDNLLNCLYNIINKRSVNKKGTIVTTNMTSASMIQRFGEPITSRLLEGEVYKFEGSDKRLKKAF